MSRCNHQSYSSQAISRTLSEPFASSLIATSTRSCRSRTVLCWACSLPGEVRATLVPHVIFRSQIVIRPRRPPNSRSP